MKNIFKMGNPEEFTRLIEGIIRVFSAVLPIHLQTLRA